MVQDIRTMELFKVLEEELNKVCKNGDYFMEKYFWGKVEQERIIKILFRILVSKCSTDGDIKAVQLIQKELTDMGIEPLKGNVLDKKGMALDIYK